MPHTEAGRHRRPASPFPGAVLLAVLLFLPLLAACGGATGTARPSGPPASPSGPLVGPTATASAPDGLTPVRVQLRWVLGAEFAGYVAAIEQGYFESAGLDVTLLEGGPDVRPEIAGSEPDGPEFTVAWVPAVLQARALGSSDLVDIAQVFRRSGTLSISLRDAEVTAPADFKDHTLGVLGPVDGAEVIAAARRAGLDTSADLTVIEQDTTMDGFMAGTIDIAQATTYDGYAQVLESTNRATRQPYQPTDLNVINYRDEGTAMLQDAIFAREAWLAEEGNDVLAVAFLRASIQGWMFCRDHPADCVDATVAAGQLPDPAGSPAPSAGGSGAATATPGAGGGSSSPEPSSKLRAGHEAWAMNEVNPLIWPAPGGIGVMDPDAWQDTVEVCIAAGLLPGPPSSDAYRTDFALSALGTLSDLDTTGDAFVKGTAEIVPVT